MSMKSSSRLLSIGKAAFMRKHVIRHISKTGFIGLGNMGAHMANNLVKKGHSLVVYDVDTAAYQEVKNQQTASTPAEVASLCDTIITMLPASQHVINCYTGEHGILSKVKSGALLLDSSTIDPAVSQEVAQAAETKQARYLDSPVSGGVNAARDGILTFMVGGKDFEDAEKVLKLMGKSVVHCGEVGAGQSAKICNNMMLAISMIGTCETMALGIKLGLDPKLLAKILNMSSGRSWSSEVYNPCPGVMEGVPSSNDYKGGFGTTLMTKDLGLAQNAATAVQSPTPLGSLAHQLYRVMSQTEFAQKDFSSVFQFLMKQTKS